jgi:hypothetical protein
MMSTFIYKGRISVSCRELQNKARPNGRTYQVPAVKLFIPSAAVAAAGGADDAPYTARRSGEQTFDIVFAKVAKRRVFPAAVRVGAFAEHVVDLAYAENLGFPRVAHDLTDIEIQVIADEKTLRFTMPDSIYTRKLSTRAFGVSVR